MHGYRLGKRILTAVALVSLLFASVAAGKHFHRKLSMRKNLIRTEKFRNMHLSEEVLEDCEAVSEQSGFSKGRILALAYTHQGGDFPQKLPSLPALERTAKWAFDWCPGEYGILEQALMAIWDDLECFPLKCSASYEDSWMSRRTYGGERGHEGTDLMPPKNVSGLYPVYSVTAGTVEKLGWLEKGGYRVGIRSPAGGYFYYAHLSGYAGELAEGEEVEAGQLLGYMGDTGYGPEGTTGQFAVHLHFGIYIRGADGEEISVNPYWVLRWLKDREEESS